MSSDVEASFRQAVNAPSGLAGRDTPNLTYRLVHSTYGWALIVFVVSFAFLYLTNPPIVQCQRPENDMTRPPPNTLTIFVVSACAAVALVAYDRWAGTSK